MLFATDLARGDELIMANGDRLTGTIVAKQGNTLRFKVSYAGELSIAWSQIKSIASDRPLHLELQDGELKIGSVRRPPTSVDDQVPALAMASSGIIPLAEIATITVDRPPSEAWTSRNSLDLKVDLRRDSSNLDDIDIKSKNEWRNRTFRWQLDGEWQYLEKEGKVSKNKFELDPKLDYFFTPAFYWRGEVEYQRAYPGDDIIQTIVSSGPGYLFWDNELGQFDLAALYNNFYVRIENLASLRLDGPSLQWRFRQKLFATEAELFSNGSWLWLLNSDAKYYVEAESGLRYYLNNYIYLTLTTDLDYYNVNGSTSDDWRHRLGLGAKW